MASQRRDEDRTLPKRRDVWYYVYRAGTAFFAFLVLVSGSLVTSNVSSATDWKKYRADAELAAIRVELAQSVGSLQYELLTGTDVESLIAVWAEASKKIRSELDATASRHPSATVQTRAIENALDAIPTRSTVDNTSTPLPFMFSLNSSAILLTGTTQARDAIRISPTSDAAVNAMLEVYANSTMIQGALNVVDPNNATVPAIEDPATQLGKLNASRSRENPNRSLDAALTDPSARSESDDVVDSLTESASFTLYRDAVVWAEDVFDPATPLPQQRPISSSNQLADIFSEINSDIETIARDAVSSPREFVESEISRYLRNMLGNLIMALMSIAATGYFLRNVARQDSEHASRLLERVETDSMTKLGNRTFLDTIAPTLRDELGNVLVLHIDLDHFKPVNDTYGHAVGDKVLIAAANRLKNIAEDYDGHAARLGGDEFAVILPFEQNTKLNAICAMALDQLRTFEIDGLQITLGASIGAARGNAAVADLLLNADLALHQAKRSGRGVANDFKASAGDFVSFVRNSLLAGDVGSVYQVQVDVQSSRTVGIEVFPQLFGNDQNVIPAKDFLGIAEWLGVTSQLFEHVVEAVKKDLQKSLKPVAPLWFNINPNDLMRPDGVENVITRLQSLGIPPRLIGIELANTASFPDPSKLVYVVSRLRQVGVGVALDGFGASSSPLGSLVDLPVTRVKLDAALVSRLDGEENPTGWIAAAVAELAAKMNVEVLGDGVSSGAQLRTLSRIGVPIAQGVLLGLPDQLSNIPRRVGLGGLRRASLESIVSKTDLEAPKTTRR